MTTRRRAAARWVAVVAVTAAALTGCGGDNDDDTSAPGPGADDRSAGELQLVGENIDFEPEELQVAAGQEVTVVFDHRDRGVAHNVRIKAGDQGDFATDLESGPVVQRLTFTIDEPGRYTFVCDVHPQMRGTVVVS